MKKNMLRNQKGFTLIEIIAVLVILGILAAVAIPKYFDLQTDARNAAAQGALAAGAANVQMVYAKLLVAGTEGTGVTNLVTSLKNVTAKYTDLGDFTAGYDATTDGKGVKVTVSANTGSTGTPSSKDVPVTQ